MPRDPMSTVRMIGNSLLKLPINKPITINRISERSSIHWKTTKKFLELISFVQQRVPIIDIKQNNGIKNISIIEMPKIMTYPPSIRLMIRMYLSGNITPTSMINDENLFLYDDEKEILDRIVNAGYIHNLEGSYYLTPLGVSLIINDVKEFFEDYGDKEKSSGKAQAPIIIDSLASVSAIRARCLYQPVTDIDINNGNSLTTEILR